MSHSPGRKDIVEFLVYRKFPSSILATLSDQPRPKGTTTLGRTLRHEEISRYRSELENLPSDQLQPLYEKETAAALADMQREEGARFFNQPHAKADFDHWSKTEHWSLDEAIALALGKAPEIVSWDKIKTYIGTSPFVKQYSRLRDLAERAKVWAKLYDPILPPLFLKWAEDNEIAVPAELSEKVSKLKGKLVDWEKQYADMKAAYDRLRSSYDQFREMYHQHIADWKGVAEKKSDLIESKQKRIAELEGELAAVNGAPPAPEPAKTQSLIERQNMLKAIFGMAVRGYSYNPADKRSKTVAEIVSDLELQGIPLSDDTIRRYLKEARDLLNEWQQQGE
jgi:hypothetical protein